MVQNQYKYLVKKQEKSLDQLRDKLQQLREFTKTIPGYENITLTLEQAKLMHVCRICKQPDNPRKMANGLIDAFVYNYGEEYAHQECLK